MSRTWEMSTRPCPACDGGHFVTLATNGVELYEAGTETCEACRGTGKELCDWCCVKPAVQGYGDAFVCEACALDAHRADTLPAPAEAT
jgi:hypothetical protein